VRLVHARWEDGARGAALFKPTGVVVPLAERELWGDAGQLEALRLALGAESLEPVPGLVVRASESADAEPSWFRTNHGEQVLEISFLGAPQAEDWHRVLLSASGERGVELLDASVLIHSERTVVLVSPIGDFDEALIIGVTPMGGTFSAEEEAHGFDRPGAADDAIHMAGREGVTYPVMVKDSRVLPLYPESARARMLSGKVILELVVRTDGTVDGIVVLRMPEGGERLAGATVEAISQWRYEPAALDGVPVNAYFTVVTEFALR
jgi:TonB family protein